MRGFKVGLSKKSFGFVAGAIALATWAQPASASALVLDYSVSPLLSGYHYNFSLSLANQDSSWVPGQQWDWIIFGDAQNHASPLADFANFSSTDPNVAFSTTIGPHNGPTIIYGANAVFLPGWQPTAIGSMLNWSGDSQTMLGAGQLKFSTLVYSTGASSSDFQTATFEVSSPVPEPATWAMMLLGFSGMGVAMRRRRRVTALKQAA